MKSTPTLELVTLAAIWGASFLFMRIGSPEFGPILFMALRTLVASLLLVPLLFIYRQQRSLQGLYLHTFIVGLLNTAIPFVLFGYAILTLPAGITSVLNATAPMFGAIVAYMWLKDKLSLSAIAGLVIGFIGVYCLMFERIDFEQGRGLLPTLAVLGATLCYGISANYTKKYLSNVKPLANATGSQLAATIVLLPIALCYLPSEMPSSAAISSVIALGTLCTGFAYILFFRLIAALGPAKAISVTYLIPVFGILWGTLFLDEEISMWMMIGGCLILFGVGLTTGIVRALKTTSIVKKQTASSK